MLEFNATFFIAMVSFIIFIMIMNAILYKPLERITKERKDFIDKNNEKARVAKEKVETLKDWEKSSIEKAQKTSREMYQKIIREYKDKKELLEEWGRNARRLSVEVYDKAKLSAQVAEVLEKTFINLMK